MCLGIPSQILEIVEASADQLAIVEVEGTRRTINIGMLEVAPTVGDWVLVHMGIALEVIDEARAEELASGLETTDQTREDSLPEVRHA